jgi:hypothetical protein
MNAGSEERWASGEGRDETLREQAGGIIQNPEYVVYYTFRGWPESALSSIIPSP